MKKKLTIILLIISIIINIYLINKDKKKIYKEEINIIEKTKEESEVYNKNKKYYTKLNYKKFIKLYKDKKIHIIAITNNLNNSKNKFIDYINKCNYYDNKTTFLLIPDELSKKNQAKYYNLNESFNYKGNYIIKVKNSKILSVTYIEDKYLDELLN